MDQGQEKTTDVVQQPIVKSVEEKIGLTSTLAITVLKLQLSQ